jgi:hypothetical protein
MPPVRVKLPGSTGLCGENRGKVAPELQAARLDVVSQHGADL